MVFVALDEAAGRGELLLVQDGLCRFHLRRDGVVVVRELLVLPFRRRTGVGRRLVDLVRQTHPGRPVVARCPAAYPSNGFWARLGFLLVETARGVNVWRHPNSCTAPTATASLPPSP